MSVGNLVKKEMKNVLGKGAMFQTDTLEKTLASQKHTMGAPGNSHRNGRSRWFAETMGRTDPNFYPSEVGDLRQTQNGPWHYALGILSPASRPFGVDDTVAGSHRISSGTDPARFESLR